MSPKETKFVEEALVALSTATAALRAFKAPALAEARALLAAHAREAIQDALSKLEHLSTRVADAGGSKEWRVCNVVHREDGPAIERPDGTQLWFYEGQLHRKDGPAIEAADGTREWWSHGKVHRDGGPAIESPRRGRKWVRDGILHREDGPAIEKPDGALEWYFQGHKVPVKGGGLEEFQALVQANLEKYRIPRVQT